MRFHAYVSKAGASVVAEFPDCPGCVAVAGPTEDIGRNAAAVLRVWIESLLLSGGMPPLPLNAPERKSGTRLRAIEVPPLLALRIHTRHFRHLNGLTTSALADTLGIPEAQVLKLEHPGGEPSPRTVQRMTDALGLRATDRRPKPPKQAELFPSERSGTLIRLTELAAYDVSGDLPDVDLDVTLTTRGELLDEMQASATAAGVTLADWLVQAGRDRLARERSHGLDMSDGRQAAFGFVGASVRS